MKGIYKDHTVEGCKVEKFCHPLRAENKIHFLGETESKRMIIT
jgi:hypothetical protein